jgi:hypothetical protein
MIWFVLHLRLPIFRKVANKWYAQKRSGKITSDSFQLHPPIHSDANKVTNESVNMILPLLMCAEFANEKYTLTHWNTDVIDSGEVILDGAAKKRQR